MLNVTKAKFKNFKLEKKNLLRELTELNQDEWLLLCRILVRCHTNYELSTFANKWENCHNSHDLWADVAFMDRGIIRDRLYHWWHAGPTTLVEESLNHKLGV